MRTIDGLNPDAPLRTSLEPLDSTKHAGLAVQWQWRRFEQAIAIAVLMSIPIRAFWGPGITIGVALSAMLVPVWLVTLKRYWGARFFFTVGIAAALSGVALSKLAAIDHAVSQSEMLSTTFLLLLIVGGVGVILWARTILSPAVVGFAFGFGAFMNSALHLGTMTANNQWKALWAVPVAILLLSLVNRRRSLWPQFAVLMFLGVLSAAFSGRSLFSTFLLAAALVAWQARPQLLSTRLSWVWTATLLGSMGLLMYLLGSTLLVDGYLGAEAQAKSIKQIDMAGSLILGGRPELTASLALFQSRPWGFGSGVAPTYEDLMTAKAGMATINYNPDNGYVEKYMFGSGFELHSVLGDAWAHFGLLGILLIGTIAVLAVRSVAMSISARECSGLVLAFVWYTLWNLFFSPLYTSTPILILAVGMALPLNAEPSHPPRRAPVRQAAGVSTTTD